MSKNGVTLKTIVVKNVFYVFYFSIKNMFFNVFFILCMFFLFLKTFIIYTDLAKRIIV